MERLLCVVAFAASVLLSLNAHAGTGETFWWNGQAGGSRTENAVVGVHFACWTNATHQTAVAPSAGNDYIVCGGNSVCTDGTSANVFPGERLTFGFGTDVTPMTLIMKSAGAVVWAKMMTNVVFTQVKEFVWVRGRFRGNTASTSPATAASARRDFCTGISGRMRVVNVGDENECHLIQPTDSTDGYGPRNLMLASDLVSEEDVEITCTGPDKPGVEASLGGVRLYLAGNNVGYKGSFRASAWHTVSLFSDTALGDPDAPNPAALTLESYGGFEVNPLAKTGRTRGVTLAPGAEGTFVTTHAATDRAAVGLPIAGEGVPFRSIGPGTIIYSGAYSAGVWTVEEGTLVVDGQAAFPEGHIFIVKTGAELRLAPSQAHCHVVSEPGGIVTFDAVPYDDATGTATPLDYTGIGTPALPFRVALSDKVRRAGDVRIPVLRLPADSTATADDFFADPASVFTPMFVSFEIVDGTDSRMVYMKVQDHSGTMTFFTPEAAAASAANPKAFELASTESAEIGGETVYMWSDRKAARAGRHYAVTNGVICTASGWRLDDLLFPGETLSVFAPGKLVTRHSCVTFGKVYFGPGSSFVGNGCGWDESPHGIDGDIWIGGTSADPVRFSSRWASENGRFAINAISVDGSLFGDGTLVLDGQAVSDVRIQSTNEAFRGCLTLSVVGDPVSNASLAVRHPYSLGGKLASSHSNFGALVIDGSYANLKPLETMTLDTPGRGITLSGKNVGFCTPDGVTLTVLEPIRSVNGMRKLGKGALALGGGIAYGVDGTVTDNGSNCVLNWLDGGLKPLDVTTLSGAKVRILGDVSLVLDANPADASVREYGFFNRKQTSFVFEAGSGDLAVKVEGAETIDKSVLRVTVPICTVPNSGDVTAGGVQAADRVRERLRLLPLKKGYKGRIVEDVPEAYPDMIRFSAVYERKGFLMVLR